VSFGFVDLLRITAFVDPGQRQRGGWPRNRLWCPENLFCNGSEAHDPQPFSPQGKLSATEGIQGGRCPRRKEHGSIRLFAWCKPFLC